MLQEILEYIHNYFIQAPNPGTYTISGDTVSPLPDLLNGQRVWIVGSALNDGVYTYLDCAFRDDDDEKAAGLHAETYAGTICALAVPPSLIALAGEIKRWADQNRETLDSPLQSESFNGYSYTMKTGTGNGGTGLTWRDCPAAKALERWRKPFL